MSSISIIVPVYRAAATIGRCVESILNQSYEDWQLILVNDGSPDNSIEICRRYAINDSRIIILDKSNGGPSSARNMGLAYLKTKWVTFVDADDYLAPYALEYMIEDGNDEIDLVISDAIFRNINGEESLLHYKPQLLWRKDFCKLFTECNLHRRTSVWGKVFKSELIKTKALLFDEQMYHAEDLVFLFKYFSYCNNIYFNGKPCYYYVFSNADSLTQRFNSFVSESYGTNQIRSAIDQLCESASITDPIAKENLFWPISFSISRCLNAIYHTEVNAGFGERVRMIKSLDLNEYKRHLPATYDSKLKLLNFILLRLRWVWLYDFIRVIKISFSS